jgi:hypothetical protein
MVLVAKKSSLEGRDGPDQTEDCSGSYVDSSEDSLGKSKVTALGVDEGTMAGVPLSDSSTCQTNVEAKGCEMLGAVGPGIRTLLEKCIPTGYDAARKHDDGVAHHHPATIKCKMTKGVSFFSRSEGTRCDENNEKGRLRVMSAGERCAIT